jgi:hypothetical protein
VSGDLPFPSPRKQRQRWIRRYVVHGQLMPSAANRPRSRGNPFKPRPLDQPPALAVEPLHSPHDTLPSSADGPIVRSPDRLGLWPPGSPYTGACNPH